MLPISRVTKVLVAKGNCHVAYRKIHTQPVRKYIQSIQRYIFSSYYNFVKNYETKVELKFPAAFQIYRVVKIGLQDLFIDMKEYVRVLRKINAHDKNLECLTRKELELYIQMPQDMLRVAPVLIISTLPFTNYITFPLALLFPRLLLSSHFWSLQQRIQFAVIDQKHKLKYYKPVFRSLQAKLHILKKDPIFPYWSKCIALLGSGLHPNPETIAKCIPLFGYNHVYHLKNISSSHARFLLKIHNMYGFWRKKYRLSERAKLIQLMDLAIIREGGVSKMTHDDIRMACFFRGLNPTNMNTEETISWLSLWVEQTSNTPKDCSSFVLHLPILMSYNHPSNWVLTH